MSDFLELLKIVSPWVAVYFSLRWGLRNFHSQKWWERQEGIYSKLIEDLYALIHADKEYIAQGARPTTIEESETREVRNKELEKRTVEAQNRVDYNLTVGEFIISENIAEELRAMNERIAEEWRAYHTAPQQGRFPNPMDETVAKCITIETATLKKISKLAKRDLCIQPKRRLWLWAKSNFKRVMDCEY